MPLRRLLESTDCTVQDFEIAAEQKFWEGFSLIVSGESGAGIYLLGFSAEMLLKNASFRLDRSVRPTTSVEPRLKPAKAWLSKRRPTISHESYHSLWFWMNYLREYRRFLGRPLPAQVDDPLVRQVRSLYATWWIEMRYRPNAASQRDAQIVYDAVVWIRDNYFALWR